MKQHRRIIYIAGFVFTISLALTSYINSSFLEAYTNSYYVGVMYVISSLLSIFALLLMPDVLSRLGNKITTVFLGLATVAAFVVLAISSNIILVLSAFIIHFLCINLLFANLDIFMEDFSSHKSIGGARGIYLAVMHVGWVLSQLVSGTIIARSSFEGLYLLSAFFMLIFSLIFIFSLRDFRDPKYEKVPILKTIKVFIQDKHLSKIYLVSFILKLFYAWMIIYTPIYLSQHIGFAWSEIGIIFSIMLLPFILLSFPLGRLSDSIGERKMLLLGFLIASIATAIIPFVSIKEIWVWALVLFMTRVGAATIEIMSESYFFKYITKKNADEMSFFKNTGPLSYVIAPILAIPTLYFVPSFEYLFYILGIVLLLGFFIALRLKDVK